MINETGGGGLSSAGLIRVTENTNQNNALSTAGRETEVSTTGINELAGGDVTRAKGQEKQIAFDMRCACPAIIQEVNYDNCTVSCQPVIKEKIQLGTQELQEMQLPLISDIPLVYPSSQNGFSITFPVQVGDECLLIFADTCIDAWWQNGGIQSQFEERRHDLSDAFCIPCQMSLPVKNTVNPGALEIKCSGDINITATGKIKLVGSTIELN